MSSAKDANEVCFTSTKCGKHVWKIPTKFHIANASSLTQSGAAYLLIAIVKSHAFEYSLEKRSMMVSHSLMNAPS